MREQEGDQNGGLILANGDNSTLTESSDYYLVMYAIWIIIISAPPTIFHYQGELSSPDKLKLIKWVIIMTSFSKTVNDSVVVFRLFFVFCSNTG